MLILTLAFGLVAVGAGNVGQGAGGGRSIVVFKDTVDNPRAAANEKAKEHGLGLTAVYTTALKGFAATLSARQFVALQNDPDVAYIEADLAATVSTQALPTGVDRIDADLNATANIDGVDDRVDVDIAIIDTGIDLDHPDLNVFQAVDCTKGPNCEKGGDGNDGNGHGTHVAGTAAALDNGTGVVGVAPGARLWAVKVLRDDGSGFFSDVIEGIDYVTANAGQIEVANMSLGGQGKLDSLETAINNSIAAGVIYAVAAGNSSSDVYGDGDPNTKGDNFIPASYPDVVTVSALADFDGVAGGLGSPTCRDDQDDTLADFSNFGAGIDITAPGVCILSTWNNGGTHTISGTSMASPHVAGGAALLASGANAPTDKTGVDAIVQTLLSGGSLDWTDDSGDGIQEPLLDVGDTEPGPQSPTANAGPDQTVTDSDGNGSEDVTLDGSGSSDTDGTIASYEWKEGTTVLGTTAIITASFDIAGSPHTVTLTVTDNDGLTGTDEVVITVVTNQSPTADAGPDQTVSDSDSNGLEDVTLDGSGSSDPDGTIASYEWTEGTTVLGTAAIITASFTVAGSPHTVTLTVTDNAGATASDSVVITVNEPSATATSVSVASVTYATSGGKNGDKHLLITVALVDDLGDPVSGASVSIDLFLDLSLVGSGTGTTGTDGNVTFSLKNASSGCYTTDVTDVTADGLTWDNATQANEFCK